MSQFEITNGFVRILDDELRIEASPIKALRKIHDQRPSVFYLIILVWVGLIGTSALTYSSTSTIIKTIEVIVILGLPAIVVAEKILWAVGWTPYRTISTKSIDTIEINSRDRIKTAVLTINYTDNDGEEKAERAWITIFGIGRGDLLSEAISTLKEENFSIESEK